jgi:outer membrane receptor for monomeric catechols
MPLSWWRLRGGYNYLHKNLRPHGGLNVNASVREGNDPEHHFMFHSIVDLPANFQFDVTGRYVSELPAPVVSAYFTLSARLAWQYKQVELSVAGQNLLDAEHGEFGTREIPRGVYGKVTWRF